MNLLKKAALFTTALLVGCAADLEAELSEVTEEPSPITWTECSNDIGDHPCDFTLKDQNSENWNLYENYGSIIVLDFSTEWCGYCQVGASTIQEIQDEYAESGVIIVTILIEDAYGNPASEELTQRWSDHFGIEAPVLAGSRELLSSDPAAGWPVTGYPSYFFIDREMVVRNNQPGYSDEGLRVILGSMLAQEEIEA